MSTSLDDLSLKIKDKNKAATRLSTNPDDNDLTPYGSSVEPSKVISTQISVTHIGQKKLPDKTHSSSLDKLPAVRRNILLAAKFDQPEK